MAEIFLTLHHVPPANESAVCELIDRHNLNYAGSGTARPAHLSPEYWLYDDQWTTYEAGDQQSLELRTALDDLGCAYEISVRASSNYVDYSLMHDPQLGDHRLLCDTDGDDTLPVAAVEQLAELDSIEAVRESIGRLTGKAWLDAFATYEFERIVPGPS